MQGKRMVSYRYPRTKTIRFSLVIAACILSCGRKEATTTDTVPVPTMRLFGKKLPSPDDTTIFDVTGAIRLPPGWHTYWHNPGDAGLPPRFEALTPKGWLGGVHLPVPERITEGSITTIGFHEYMPFRLKAYLPGDTNTPFSIRAAILICKEQCIPVSCTASISFNRNDVFRDSLSATPFGMPDTILTVLLTVTDTTLRFAFSREGAEWPAGKPVDLFVAVNGIAAPVPAPRFSRSGDTLHAVLERPSMPIAVPGTVEGLLVVASENGTGKGIEFTAVRN
jgi:hypothetical protein